MTALRCWWQILNDEGEWETIQCADAFDDFSNKATVELVISEEGPGYIKEVFLGKNGFQPVIPPSQLGLPADDGPWREDPPLDFDEKDEDSGELKQKDMGEILGWATLQQLSAYPWEMSLGSVEPFVYLAHLPNNPEAVSGLNQFQLSPWVPDAKAVAQQGALEAFYSYDEYISQKALRQDPNLRGWVRIPTLGTPGEALYRRFPDAVLCWKNDIASIVKGNLERVRVVFGAVETQE